MPPKIFPVKSEKNKKFSSRATNSNNRHTLHIRPNKLDVSAGTGKSTISRDRTGGKQADEQDILLLLSEFTAKGRRLHLRQKHETDESAGLNKQPPPPPPPPPLEEIGAEDELDIAEDNREKEVDVVEVIDRDDYSDYEGGGESGEPSWRRDYESRSGKKRRIDSWRTGKAPRVDSWQTLPDEDLPPSERDYEETEEQDTIKVEGKESKDSSDDDLHSRPNPSDMVATTGSRIAHQIGLDLYDESPVSNYLGWLLDKLDRQANELRYWREGGRSRSPSVTRTERSKPPSLKEEIKPRIPKHQVLHRVQCRLNNHRHTSGVFFDTPKRQNFILNGDDPVYDVTKYLRDNEDIVFVVFHDYYCASSADTRASRDQLERSKKTRNEDIMTPEYESIYVVSDVLREALLEVADSDPFDSSFDSEMQAPYLFVFHKRKVLQELADTGKDDIGIHVGLLLKYIYSRYGSDYEDADAKFARGVVTSDHFTKLWVPNELLIERETKGGTDRRGTYVNTDWPTNCRSFEKGYTKVLQLDVWCWEYDGMQCKREKFLYGVDLDGQAEMAIDHLLIFPRRFASDAVQEQLKARGKKYWSFRFQHLANYTGYDFQDETRYASNRFMIDIHTYKRMHSDGNKRGGLKGKRFDDWPETISNDEEISDDNAMLLPASIFGFDFQDKQWVNLCVDLVKEVEWNKEAFFKLVLPSKTKELIQALITTQISGQIRDVIENKGSGLVILLHGGPGTGKTLTAESVAEMAEKPLYRVTCGDIGTDAVEVESYLTSIFHLGKIWGCVLLLDEADVFLEERTLADLQRNSIVSVFLRLLEYYDGILILTSNRVGTFDAAFKSRIQVSLHYPNLSRAARKKIWRNFIDMLEGEEDEVDIAELERNIDNLSEEEMNGRQIRNCVTTARQLALFRRQKLGWKHLEQVIRTASDFNRYLNEVHEGLTEDEIARGDNLR